MPIVTVIIPTLFAGHSLIASVAAVQAQTLADVEIIVVDNSGCGRAADALQEGSRCRILCPSRNIGFAAAMNLGIRASSAEFIASLNDDAEPEPQWLASLLEAAGVDSRVGMYASQILMHGSDVLDSAGMLICLDGVAKQRGHGVNARVFPHAEEVLFPSGCAALYRRAMLQQIGLFDEDLFLYCEDSDLGLRARRAGWKCLYVPGARVHHHYSQSAGKASSLKAWYIERNRLRVALRNFPLRILIQLPIASAMRYLWTLRFALRPESPAFEFRRQNSTLRGVLLILRAHLAALLSLRLLLQQRATIRKTAALSNAQFVRILQAHSVGAKQVAELL